MERYGNTHVKTYLALFRDTILTLMGREVSSHIKEDELSVIPDETKNYHKAIRCYWIGHTERCHYFTGKIAGGNNGDRHHNTHKHSHKRFFMLYYGINSIQLLAKQRKTAKTTKEIPKGALRTLKESLRSSSWTFRNKVPTFLLLFLSFNMQVSRINLFLYSAPYPGSSSRGRDLLLRGK